VTQVMKENDRERGLILANGEILKVFASLNKRRKCYALLRLRRCLFSVPGTNLCKPLQALSYTLKSSSNYSTAEEPRDREIERFNHSNLIPLLCAPRSPAVKASVS
jgi:hypothetical protein